MNSKGPPRGALSLSLGPHGMDIPSYRGWRARLGTDIPGYPGSRGSGCLIPAEIQADQQSVSDATKKAAVALKGAQQNAHSPTRAPTGMGGAPPEVSLRPLADGADRPAPAGAQAARRYTLGPEGTAEMNKSKSKAMHKHRASQRRSHARGKG